MFRESRYADANELLEQSLALPPADDAPQQALAWKTLSSVRYDLGEYQPAILAGLSALDLYRRTGDVYWQGIVLGNLSSVYAELGRDADALATAREALKDAQGEHDSAGVVYCLSQLAGLYQQQGDLESALRTFHEGLAWVSEIGYAPLVEAEIQKNIGAFYAQIGQWEKASEALRRCIEIEKGQNIAVSLEARGLLTTVMQHQGKLREAVAEATTAIENATQLGLKQNQAELLLKRASVQMELHHQAAAEADIAAASGLTADLSSRPLQIEVALATADAQLAVNADAAAVLYRKAVQLAEEAGEQEEKSAALAGLAKALERGGQLDDALTSVEDALKIVETSRGSLPSRELQTSYFPCTEAGTSRPWISAWNSTISTLQSNMRNWLSLIRNELGRDRCSIRWMLPDTARRFLPRKILENRMPSINAPWSHSRRYLPIAENPTRWRLRQSCGGSIRNRRGWNRRCALAMQGSSPRWAAGPSTQNKCSMSCWKSIPSCCLTGLVNAQLSLVDYAGGGLGRYASAACRVRESRSSASTHAAKPPSPACLGRRH